MKLIKYEETISQLNDLIRDRKSFIHGNDNDDSIFNEDIKALKTAIKVLEKADNKRINYLLRFTYGLLLGGVIGGSAFMLVFLLVVWTG